MSKAHLTRRLPGPRGVRHAQYLREFVASPHDALLDMHREYGDVAAIGFRPYRLVSFAGPDASRAILLTEADAFRCREAYSSLRPIGGDAALLLSEGDAHRERRRLVQSYLGPEHSRAVVPLAVDATLAAIATLTDGCTVDVVPFARRLVCSIVVESLFGPQLAAHSNALRERLDLLLAFVNLWPWQQVTLRLPGGRWTAARRARLELDRIISDEMAQRRASPDGERQHNDLLSCLMAQGAGTAAALGDNEIRDLVRSLITAGYDTTASALTWAMWRLARDPVLWARVTDELCTQPCGTRGAHANGAPLLNAVITETLRLHSPILLGARYAIRPFTFRGSRVPAGTMVAYTPYVTHQLYGPWPDLDEFRPARWLDSSGNARRPARSELIAFGDGGRRCPGEALARLELVAILSTLMRSVVLTPDEPAARPRPAAALSANYPRRPIVLRVTRVHQ